MSEVISTFLHSDFVLLVSNYGIQLGIRHFGNDNKQRVTKCSIKTMGKIISDPRRGDIFMRG